MNSQDVILLYQVKIFFYCFFYTLQYFLEQSAYFYVFICIYIFSFFLT